MNFQNAYKVYKLRDWVPLDKIDFMTIAFNPLAIDLIETHIEKIYDTSLLFNNNNAKHIVEKLFNISEYNEVCWQAISSSEEYATIIEENFQYIIDSWMFLSRYQFGKNPGIVHLMENFIKRDFHPQCVLDLLDGLFQNPNPKVIPIIEKYMNRITPDMFLQNVYQSPHLHYFIDKGIVSMNQDVINNMDDSNKRLLSSNSCNKIIMLLDNNQKLIDWPSLCMNKNPRAIKIIEKNLHKLDSKCWSLLSINQNAIHILENNVEKVNWDALLYNQNAGHLLDQRQNIETIDWETFSANPAMFEVDYNYLKQRMKNTFAEELIANRFHPKNMDKWFSWGFDENMV